MLAAQTIRNPNKRSCKLLRGISMAIRERPKLVWIEVFHPARPYCSPKAMQKRINTPLITRVANIRDAHSFELPHLVRTVQKSPLAGNIKFLGGEASRQRRLSRF